MVGFTEPKMYEPRPGWRVTLAQWVEHPPGAPDSWQYQISTYWRWRTLDGLSLREAWKELGMEPSTAQAALNPPAAASGLVPPEVFSRVLARSRAKDINPDDDVSDVEIPETPPNELPDKPEVGFTPARMSPPRPALYQPRAGWKAALGNAPINSTNWLAQLTIYWRKRTEEKKNLEQAWEELRYRPTDAGTSLNKDLWDRGSIPPEIIGRVVARSQGDMDPDGNVEGIILYPELSV